MKISQVVQEALPISTAKTYVKSWDPNFHKEVFLRQPRKDKNAYRVYIPFELETQKQVIIPTNLLTYLQTAIPGKPYTTDTENYMQGLAFEVANPNRKLGIGKMLARSEGSEKDPSRKAELQSIKKAFDADPQRAATKKADKLIVISRHPYDVAGMSTDRGWKSCMNLVDGINRHYVLRDVKQGSIIAYLINADDLNVRKPLARILIKPYQEKGNPKNLVMMGDMVYGTAPENFKSLVDAWINKNYNEGKGGLFCLAKGLYRDMIPQQIRMLSNDKLKELTLSQMVTAAVNDHNLWPRVAELRPDADEVFWQVAEKDDTRAARLIKHIDLKRFKKAIRKKGQILARLHTQTDEMIQAALDHDRLMVKYVRNRTPEQHAAVLKFIAQYPSGIKSVHMPTMDQLQLAIKKDSWLWSWVMHNHPEAFTVNQVKNYVINRARNEDLDQNTLPWVKNTHPDLLKDPEVFKSLSIYNPDWLWNNMKLSDADVVKLVLFQPKADSWSESWLELHAQMVMNRLKQVSRDLIDNKFIGTISSTAPYMLAAFPDVLGKDTLLKLVRSNPSMINHWPDPDADMVYTAIRHDEDETVDVPFDEDKYDSVWLKLIGENPNYILRRNVANDKLVRKAALHDDLDNWLARTLLTKYKPSVATQIILLKRRPYLIKNIVNPSLAAQLAAVNADPDVYNLIKPKDRHASTKAYMAAYRKEMRKPE